MVKNMEGMSVLGLELRVREEDLIEQEAHEAHAEAFRSPFMIRSRYHDENLGDSDPEMYSPVLKDDLAVSADILASCLQKVKIFVGNKFSSHEQRFEELKNMQEMGSTRIDSITPVIRTKPKRMRIKYQAPTIWTMNSTLIYEF